MPNRIPIPQRVQCQQGGVNWGVNDSPKLHWLHDVTPDRCIGSQPWGWWVVDPILTHTIPESLYATHRICSLRLRTPVLCRVTQLRFFARYTIDILKLRRKLVGSQPWQAIYTICGSVCGSASSSPMLYVSIWIDTIRVLECNIYCL